MSFGTVSAAYLSVVNNSLLAEWGFNKGSGVTAADTSGSGYVATVGGWTTVHTVSGADEFWLGGGREPC